jgi:uncharacterized integral membrane protein
VPFARCAKMTHMSADIPTSTPTDPAGPAAPKRPRTPEEKRRIAIGVLVGIVTVFALFNLNEVKVSWVVTSWKTPLVVVIVVSAGLGALAGVLVDRKKHRPPPPPPD